MYFILTDVGQAAITSSPTPPVLTLFSFGNGYNYTPVSSQTALHGSAVYSGTPAAPVVAGPNLLRYTAVVDSSVGDFTYGELGLYLPSGELFAIGAQAALVHKNSVPSNNLVVDCFIPVVGANYDAYTYIANSANALDVNVSGSLDSLPVASDAQTNIFIAPSRVYPSSVTHVATTSGGLWAITGYSDRTATGTASSSGTSVSVTSWSAPVASPTFAGQLLLQPTSGPNAGSIRVISNIVSNTITLENAFASPMLSGNTFEIKALSPSFNDAKNKQDALYDVTGAPIPLHTHVPTQAQVTAMIASALSSVPAASLTGLVDKLVADAAGNGELNSVTNAFGTPIGRILPT